VRELSQITAAAAAAAAEKIVGDICACVFATQNKLRCVSSLGMRTNRHTQTHTHALKLTHTHTRTHMHTTLHLQGDSVDFKAHKSQ